jgi:adenine-specific DNA-methyltransferase
MTASKRERAHLRVPPAILLRSRDLRHPLTPAEQKLWSRLRNHGLGPRFRRQQALLGRYIVDFYCAEAALCIEVDGDTHAMLEQAKYDAVRTQALERAGYHVIRFSNAEVMGNLEGVLCAIQAAIGVGEDSPPPPPSP